jgi:hypothetical protein
MLAGPTNYPTLAKTKYN